MKLKVEVSADPAGKSRARVSAISDSTGTPRRAASASRRRSISSGRSMFTDTPSVDKGPDAPQAGVLSDPVCLWMPGIRGHVSCSPSLFSFALDHA